MNKLKAFILGMSEFRSDFTTSCLEADAYDWGRDVAHRVTLRQFEAA